MRTSARRAYVWLTASLLALLTAHYAPAQGTLDDYRRAAAINQPLTTLTTNVIQGAPTWIGSSNRFWYRVSVPGGFRFVLVDAAAWQKQPAFDHERLASMLSGLLGQSITGVTLPFNAFSFVNNDQAIEFDANRSRFRCTLSDYACARTGAARDTLGGFRRLVGMPVRFAPPMTPRMSPDSQWVASIQNYNVALRAVKDTAQLIMLSYDGSEGDAYQLASIEWSPDSKKLVAYRRRPGYNREVHYVRSSPTDQLQPRDSSIFYRKPGDVLDFIQPVLFDVATHQQTSIDHSLFPNPYQISRPVWRKDSRAYTFEYNQRGHQVYRVLEVAGNTGRVRVLVDEQAKTFFSYRETNPNLTDTGKNWRYDIDDGKEILWLSERDGWNHIYLYDGATGKVKQQVTKGPWVVKYVDSVDVAKRQIYFRALGMNRDHDPYFIHFYRINFDGTGLVAYTAANGTHQLSWSPDHSYYVDTYSRVDLPTVVELRRVSDRALLPLEKGDMSAALAAGWQPPEVFVAKGRDGVTDIWGIIVRPHTFDPNRKYPVIEQIYAGPQGSFVPKNWGGGQNLLSTAEIGFVLVQIDGMGTNNRSKAFHDVAWKNLGDAGFADRILWHRAVAAKYPWYDIARVGVYGSSAGGQNAAGAVLFHPEFYQAAFASSGCHDNRMDKIWWNEQWMGELGPHYEASSNIVNASRLKGHLFLAVGEMDTNVDPSSTMQFVDALIRAGKDFDLLVVPNGGHGATGPDGTRRRNDFFVRWLLGVNPPDWNSGISLPSENRRALGARDNGPPSPDFFDDPSDNMPPYWWW